MRSSADAGTMRDPSFIDNNLITQKPLEPGGGGTCQWKQSWGSEGSRSVRDHLCLVDLSSPRASESIFEAWFSWKSSLSDKLDAGISSRAAASSAFRRFTSRVLRGKPPGKQLPRDGQLPKIPLSSSLQQKQNSFDFSALQWLSSANVSPHTAARLI